MKILHGLLALTLLACAATEPAYEPATPASPGIELRAVVPAGAQRAIELAFEGEPLALSEPATFRVSRAYPTADALGLRAVGFEIAASDRAAFTEYTRGLTGERMAMIVDGEVVCAPVVTSPLPGAGIIAGGSDGFDEARVEALVAALRGRE